ncbi:hypothetical protein Q4E93_21510 [Flavitalea sp. BT771]|uniref:hypothetical protein n=1 Tax=Flavitalea sp. BT771 TaxID=3063329 RepID=UPI0026E15DA6|nr:hypothetical protein [Flavitalea sp. BT771]MDO6433202.1 hypothetical protein [Flavitalea sp. BT771]MDV6221522.1 hypothetical protein [Flavitalea sp. BT771]
MDQELLDNIKDLLSDVPSGRVLSPSEAEGLLARLASAYELEVQELFPWKLAGARAVYAYDLPSSWELLFPPLLDLFQEEVYLAVTNEEGYPWAVVAMPLAYVVELVLELPYFEYFIFDEGMDRVVYDTHQEMLAVFGK